MADEKPKVSINQQIRTEITEKMINAMEIDLPPWRLPWLGLTNVGFPANFTTQRHYNGVNVLLLMLSGLYFDMKSKYWGTIGQWAQFGAYVKRRPEGVDAWGTRVVYYNFFETDKKTKKGNKLVQTKDDIGKKQKIPFMRTFIVFNVEQVEAPDVDLLAVKSLKELGKIAKKVLGETIADNADPRSVAEAISDAVDAKLDNLRARSIGKGNDEPDFEPAEALILATGAKIVPGTAAKYSPSKDLITIPEKRRFESMTAYYETTFHELGHWAMVEKRLDLMRDTTYAFNELVVEMSACFLAAELNVPLVKEMLPQNQAYVKGWIKQMGNDPKFIFDAATTATKVTDYLLSFIKQEAVKEDEKGEEEVYYRATA